MSAILCISARLQQLILENCRLIYGGGRQFVAFWIVYFLCRQREEKSRLARLLKLLKRKPAKIFAGNLSIVELTALIARSSLHLGGDSGALHIALMTNTHRFHGSGIIAPTKNGCRKGRYIDNWSGRHRLMEFWDIFKWFSHLIIKSDIGRCNWNWTNMYQGSCCMNQVLTNGWYQWNCCDTKFNSPYGGLEIRTAELIKRLWRPAQK